MTDSNEEKPPRYTLREAARKYHVTNQAIYVAIRKKKLKAYKDKDRWYINVSDLDDYQAYKYSRERSIYNGESLYKAEEKEISVRQCAKLFGVNEQHIYYLVRTHKISYVKRGSAVILKYDECMKQFGENSKQIKFA